MITHQQSKRNFMCQALGLALGLGAVGVPTAHASGNDDGGNVVGSDQIIKALTPKDFVLDRQGAVSGRASQQARRRADPSISLYVQFTFDSAVLMPQGKRQLDELAMALNDKALAVGTFMLAGHTDRVGDADYNIKLSLSRAQAVRDYLAEAHGVPESRLQAIGYGFSRLLDPSNPKAAVNRRVEVRRLMRATGQASGNANRPQGVPAFGRLVPTPQ
jgi:outer membrane protein OmpA-like peptidoglycan-associated protein